CDIPFKRWRQLIEDIDRFMGEGWAEKATVLGWGCYDLFGADRERPFARVDRAGLVWLLNGARIIMLSQDTAMIETRMGARQTYRRKPNEAVRVLAWELADGD